MDPFTSIVLFLHKVFIFCLSYVSIYNIYLLFAFVIFPIIGIVNINSFDKIPIFKKICDFLARFCDLTSVQILLILFIVLLWIFVFWMIIILFIPYIIIFPIPIIPFVFILPLKPILLALPPFSTLTETGTLPLLYKILSRIFNPSIFENFLKHFIEPTANDLNDYFYYNTKQLFNEIFYYITGNELDNSFNDDNNNFDNFDGKNEDGRTKEMANDGIETNDNPDDMDKYKEVKDSSKIKGGMAKIQEDTDLCVRMSQKFKLYNSSFSDDISTDIDNSISPYNKCYISAIKSYLNTSIK